MSDQLFVPADFAIPGELTAAEFRLEPLGPEHNAADHAAFEVAGRAFAMGGAPEAVRKKATDVLEREAGSGGGIAAAIRRVRG